MGSASRAVKQHQCRGGGGGGGGEVGQDHVSTLQSVDVIVYSSKSRGTEVLEVRCYTVEFLRTACQLFFSIVVP